MAKIAIRVADDSSREAELAQLSSPQPKLSRALLVLRDPPREPRCASCEDNCCGGPNLVKLTLADTARLIDAELDWAIGRGWYEDTGERVGVDERPTLKHHDGRCVFLDDDNRCAIHPIRPQVCRGFPYQVSPDWTQVRFAAFCRSYEERAESQVADDMIDDAIESFNERARDLHRFETHADHLREMGFDRYFENLKVSASGSFADTLKKLKK